MRKATMRQAVCAVAERLEHRCLLSAAQPNLGINIRRLGYDSGDELFADAMKEAGAWSENFATPTSTASPAPIDSNGWPMTDAAVAVVLNQSNDGGTYALSFTGQANVAPIASETAVQVVNLSYNASTNITTGQVIVPNGGNELMLDFTNTCRQPGDASDTGVTNVQLMRPSSVDSSTSYSPSTLFTAPILKLISNFSTIRYMDYSLTNNNTQVNWSDRTLPTQVQTNPRGGSWEYAVALANATGKDMWINIPEMASNQYITDLADLIAYGSDGVNAYTGPVGSTASAANPNPVPAGGPVYAGLNSNLRVYVEYSNEVWNSSFAQNAENTSAAITEVNAGNSPLNYDGSTSTAVWAARRTAERTVIASNLFRAVFGDDQMMTRIRPVYQWQYGNLNNTAAFGLTFINNYYNNADGIAHVQFPHPVNYYLWGGGGGWYGGVGNPNGTGDVTVSDGNFASPGVSGFQTDPTGGNWSFAGQAGIAANNSALGNPASTSGNQAAWLQSGGSFSETVNFTGGLADLAFSAAASGSANLAVSIDGVDASSAWTIGSAYSLQRSAVFDSGASAGPHTITFTDTGGGSLFISNVYAETANGMYKGGINNIGSTILNESSWAAAFGLQMVSYEGGFNFGSGDVGTPLQIAANQDARAEQAAISQMDEFFSAGGALGMYYDTTNHIWALTLDINDQSTPKMEAVQSVLDGGSIPLNIGATLPTSAGQSVTVANALAAGQGAAGIYAFDAPAAGQYTLVLSGQQSGSAYEQFYLDGQLLSGTTTLPSSPGSSSPGISFTITKPGLNALLLVDRGTGTVSPGGVTITAGGSTPAKATLTGTVFNDANQDGVQDNGENGAAAVTVYVDLNNSGNYVADDPSASTNSSGVYTITGLTPGSYTVREIVPAGDTQTAPGNGAGISVSLASGQTLAGVNFGLVASGGGGGTPAGSISGTVFNDANHDGIQDDGETGVAGVRVYMDPNYNHQPDSNEQSVLTDANGNFIFTNPPADPEILRIVLPSGAQQTFPANGVGDYVGKFTGQTITGENFGIYAPTVSAATISGTVFNDANHDGVQDDGETGVAGVRVYMDPNYNHQIDTNEQSVLTDANGNFVFTAPPADPEILRIILPSGAQQTFPANGVGDYVGKFTGQSIAGENFGIYFPVVSQTASITGTVFNDLNGDHAQTTGEPNLANVTVYIDLNNDGKLDAGDPTAVTNSSGAFTFTGLAAGIYTVYVSPSAGYRQTYPVTGGTKITVAAGQTTSAGKFGVTNTAYVGGTLFDDLNGNGVQNPGEGALSGWKVYIDLNNDGKYESNEPTAVTTTTSTGYWYFRAVAAGTYVIRAVAPSGYVITKACTITLTAGETVVNGFIGAKKA